MGERMTCAFERPLQMHPMMSESRHEKLAQRLADILKKLNHGESLSHEELAAEYGVDGRTIQRDFNRLSFLPLSRCEDSGRILLEPTYLGRITLRDVERFAKLAGLHRMFPGLDTQFIRELFNSRLQDNLALDVHAHSYEDLRERMSDFRALQKAIKQRQLVRFQHQKPEGSKRVEVAPYRLIHNSGVWYLAATDAGRVKAYTFSKISALEYLDTPYTPSAAVDAMLDAEDSIWLNVQKTEVTLKVGPEVADYFRRRKVISQQEIKQELSDGSIVIAGKFAHPNQILPIVRYWIPHVRIVTPQAWHDQVRQSLQTYLEA